MLKSYFWNIKNDIKENETLIFFADVINIYLGTYEC